jgi:hypothetical protein
MDPPFTAAEARKHLDFDAAFHLESGAEPVPASLSVSAVAGSARAMTAKQAHASSAAARVRTNDTIKPHVQKVCMDSNEGQPYMKIRLQSVR